MRILDESTHIGKALLNGQDRESIVQLVNCLKKLKVNVRTVIEQGPGGNTIPAVAFIEGGISYHSIDANHGLTQGFKEDLRDYFAAKNYSAKHIGAILGNLIETDVTKVSLEAKFGGILHPAMVLFYNSFAYLAPYAKETQLAKNLFEKRRKSYENCIKIQLEKEQMDAAKSLSRQNAEETIGEYVMDKYAHFLGAGDVMACLTPFHAYLDGADIWDFYRFLKNKRLDRGFLITISPAVATNRARALIEQAQKKSYKKGGAFIGRWEERLKGIEEWGKAVLIGAVCVK